MITVPVTYTNFNDEAGVSNTEYGIRSITGASEANSRDFRSSVSKYGDSGWRSLVSLSSARRSIEVVIFSPIQEFEERGNSVYYRVSPLEGLELMVSCR